MGPFAPSDFKRAKVKSQGKWPCTKTCKPGIPRKKLGNAIGTYTYISYISQVKTLTLTLIDKLVLGKYKKMFSRLRYLLSTETCVEP